MMSGSLDPITWRRTALAMRSLFGSDLLWDGMGAHLKGRDGAADQPPHRPGDQDFFGSRLPPEILPQTPVGT